MLSAVEISKRFLGHDGNVVALDNVSVDLNRGDIVVVVGPSGCGKSTLLRCIAGLESLDSGRILIGGKDISGYPPENREVEWLPQKVDATFLMHKTLHYNMGIGLRIRSVGRKEIDHRIQGACEIVGIAHLLNRTPNEVSGGELQRVAIARSLTNNSSVMLFDEPLASLDEHRRTILQKEFRLLNKKVNRAILYVTHDQREALSLGTRCIVMNAGRIEQDATPQQIYYQPANIFVAKFFSPLGLNELIGTAETDGETTRFVCDGISLSFPTNILSKTVDNSEVILAIRPESIKILLENKADTDIDLGEVEILNQQFFGRESLIHARLLQGGHEITVSSARWLHTVEPQKKRVVVNRRDIFIFDKKSGVALKQKINEAGDA